MILNWNYKHWYRFVKYVAIVTKILSNLLSWWNLNDHRANWILTHSNCTHTFRFRELLLELNTECSYKGNQLAFHANNASNVQRGFKEEQIIEYLKQFSDLAAMIKRMDNELVWSTKALGWHWHEMLPKPHGHILSHFFRIFLSPHDISMLSPKFNGMKSDVYR